jgi:Fe-S cluster assembly protein SufB
MIQNLVSLKEHYNRKKNSQVNYLEGCTAPQYDTNQLHAAVVELIALENATIKYSTVQNWYSGNEFGREEYIIS